MAIKSKNAEEKSNKKKAVKTTAYKMPVIRTSTIDVVVEQKPKSGNKEKIKNPTKSKPIKQAKVQKKQIKKQKNISQKPKKKRYNLMKLFGIIALVIASAIFLFTTPLFNVTEIEVTGNQVVSSDEIKSLSQIKLNENMFKNLKSVIRDNIKGNAYIEDVETKRILPNKIELKVQERQVKFMVKLLNNFAYINNQGYILEITEQTKEVPVIEGISTPEEEIIVGKRLNIEDLEKLETVLKIASSCEENEISKYITSINVANISEYTMIFAEKGLTIHLGNSSNLDTKMLYVKAIMQAEEENEGDIFVNGNLNDGFQPYFRKKV